MSETAVDIEDDYKLHRRFDRIGRLLGDQGMARLLGSRVMVVGLGGVGSFAAEALVRSGVGQIDLVDFDMVCVTNTNRQLQALKGAVGKFKADILGDRLAQINPQVKVHVHKVFYNERSSERLLEPPLDYVVDAIDNITAKCHLLVACKQRNLPVVTSTGASGRVDPTRIQVADLAHTRVDPLAQNVRRILRTKYGYPRQGAFGLTAVFSTETPAEPHELTYDKGQGFRCVCPGGKNNLHSCEERAVIYGTAGFVTGAFGLACASVVVRELSKGGYPP